MNILFVTYRNLSVGRGTLRSVAYLQALADAGYRVDVVAPSVVVAPHPNIHILCGDSAKPCSGKRVHMTILRAMSRRHYDAVHAVDVAVLHVGRLCRLRRVRLIYQVSRCFSGNDGEAPFWYGRFLPNHFRRMERKMLRRAALVFSPCDALTASLRKRTDRVRIVQLDDVPAQSLCPRRNFDPDAALSGLSSACSFVVVCRILSDSRNGLRSLLMAARKVIEKHPEAGFVFKGTDAEKAKALAANLDLQEHCVFLESCDIDTYLAAVSIADVAVFVPQIDGRYPHPEILTLLNSSAMVVAVQAGAYTSMLHDGNCVQVDNTVSSIADGVLRGIREPLLAFGMVGDAHQMIADHHAFSSFKHKVRMAYHSLSNAH